MLYSAFNNIKFFKHQNLCFKVLSIYCQQIISKSSQPPENIDGNEKKKKKTFIPRITLIAQDNNISITTLEEAEKLSKRRELKLVKIVDLDMKTQRPVYKLMTGSEYLAEDLNQRRQSKIDKSNTIKGEKVLILSSGIAEHDIKVHINKILKWLNKQYEVKVIINGVAENMEKAENVYKFLEGLLEKQGRIVQKRTKGSDMKFQILPPKKNKENLQNS